MASRREFLKRVGIGGAALAFARSTGGEKRMEERSNILWITSEDNGTHLRVDRVGGDRIMERGAEQWVKSFERAGKPIRTAELEEVLDIA